MKKIIVMSLICLLGLYGCVQNEYQQASEVNQPDNNDSILQGEKQLKIKISNNEYTITYLLNESLASQSLYQQLPLDIQVENYGDNEKIFYPPIPLDTTNTPLLINGQVGTLGYFAPWGDVVMYYGECEAYSGLYILGESIEGSEQIVNLRGSLHIERVEE